VPSLEGALGLLSDGVLNRAHRTNLRYVEQEVDFGQISEALRWLLLDPQTSGGILFAVAPEKAPDALKAVSGKFHRAAIIGEVVAEGAKRIMVSP
jgi:selenide,water dikinase